MVNKLTTVLRENLGEIIGDNELDIQCGNILDYMDEMEISFESNSKGYYASIVHELEDAEYELMECDSKGHTESATYKMFLSEEEDGEMNFEKFMHAALRYLEEEEEGLSEWLESLGYYENTEADMEINI